MAPDGPRMVPWLYSFITSDGTIGGHRCHRVLIFQFSLSGIVTFNSVLMLFKLVFRPLLGDFTEFAKERLNIKNYLLNYFGNCI